MVTFRNTGAHGMLAMNGTNRKPCSKHMNFEFLTDKVAFLSVHAEQAYVEVEIRLHAFLISAQDIF